MSSTKAAAGVGAELVECLAAEPLKVGGWDPGRLRPFLRDRRRSPECLVAGARETGVAAYTAEEPPGFGVPRMVLGSFLRDLQRLVRVAGQIERACLLKQVHGAPNLAVRMRLFRPQPRISPAGSAEAAALAGLYQKAWAPHRGHLDERLLEDQTPDGGEVATWFAGGFEVFTATLDGHLVGSVRCSFPTGTCFVDRLAVDPERGGRGVGRALLEHAVSRARRAGVTKVWTQASPKLREATALHRSLGFRESGHLRAHYWGEDVLLLELPL